MSSTILSMQPAEAIEWIAGRLDYAQSEELYAVQRRIEREIVGERNWDRAGFYEDAFSHVQRARDHLKMALEELDRALDCALHGERCV